MLPDTFYNRSRSVPVYGPVSPSAYQARQAIATAGPYLSFRYRQGRLILDPPATAGQILAFEYQSRNFAIGPARSGQS